MAVKQKIAAVVLAGASLVAAVAGAVEDYSATDFTPGGWGVFLSEVFRSVDLIGFALFTMLVILVGMFIDLLGHLRLCKLIPEKLLAGVQEEMANGEYENALALCENSNSLIAQVFSAALSKTDYSFERMEEAMRGELRIQGLVWRQWVGQFRTAALIGLLLGAAGATVDCMRFVSDLSGRPNFSLALASTAELRGILLNVLSALLLGCVMCLVSLVAGAFCSSKLEKILLEAERLGEELLDPFRPLPVNLEE